MHKGESNCVLSAVSMSAEMNADVTSGVPSCEFLYNSWRIISLCSFPVLMLK